MIQSILERELTKLEELSKKLTTPLDIRDIKALDTLIKAHASFVVPTPPPPDPTNPAPDKQSTEDLLEDLLNGPIES